MILSFKGKTTKDIYNGISSKRTRGLLPTYLLGIARDKLDMLDAASLLSDLKIPPSNKLEKLKGKRKHQHSIRINDQWRIVFTWKNGNAGDVEIIDYDD